MTDTEAPPAACDIAATDPQTCLDGPCPDWDSGGRASWVCEAASLRFLAASETAVRHYGFSRAEFLRMSLSDIDLLPSDAPHPASAPASLRERLGVRRHRLKSGAVIDVEVFACPIRQAGRDTCVVFAHDVTEREHERRRVLAAADQLRLAATVFERSVDAITITDRNNCIVAVNRAFTMITGYAEAEVLGRNPNLLSSGRHDKGFYQALWRSLQEKGTWEGEIWNRRKNGEVYPEWMRASVVRDAGGQVTHHVAIFSDISEAKAAEARIHRLAYYDALTGLPNRVLAHERMAAAIAEADCSGRQLAVLFVDLDHFKFVNDSLGHHIGDRLLQAVAQRLQAAVRASDTVARLGGDEFMLLLPGVGQAQDAARIAGAVVRRVSEPLALDGHTLRVSPSIGITLYPDDAPDCDTLLRNADSAMYQAKRDGRSGWRLFRPA